MFSTLLPFKHRARRQTNDHVEDADDGHPSPGTRTSNQGHYLSPRYATADFTEAEDDDLSNIGNRRLFRLNENPLDEDGIQEHASVLPLFSATHLDHLANLDGRVLESLPIYTLTHAIRIIVQARTETTLTWDQLRSPQVSQFLMKPMQQQIRTQHFSRATLYALMANCLQFYKEGQMYPGNAGTCSTRAKVCELLAIKLLKEYSTRELIDALSYDFYPLQGMPVAPVTPNTRKALDFRAKKMQAARTSTLEVAIRASAKRFLAHPLVIQHLEAIWNGAVSFYSAADSLHRQQSPSPPPRRNSALQSNNKGKRPDVRTPLLGVHSWKEEPASTQNVPLRRTVSLYDPRNASLFKLSRLRVPRYRQFLSTLSLAVLIGLFLAVLTTRSSRITGLELVFWFWSAGFMLDELVGFTEQGFSLYIMSFWNIFDLGILLLLIVYYCMRAYGLFLLDPQEWNEMAYDVLAANAILLLPRIFSVLDHYQYFSQLLIAFRLMAVDLAAVFVLVLISCSGFFVFFTLSRNQGDAADIAYKIFQILMGFSPAAWDIWGETDLLGRTLLALFMIICHFVVVTILITVLTNSFMAIASNATQEHQFLFAINTISMVKNDALFSYVAPTNIFAWLLLPLRYCMPLREFVWLNRFVIKVTHFPLLFCIYLYERFWLAPDMYDPTDLVEHPGRGRGRSMSLVDPAHRSALFSPNIRVREESVVGFQKDRALEEVFRRAPDNLKSQRQKERRKTQTAIRNWMDQADDLGTGPRNWPTINSRLGGSMRRNSSMSRDPRNRRFRQVSDVRSTASDPADLMSNVGLPPSRLRIPDEDLQDMPYKDQTDADGDDELVTNDDEDDEDNITTNTVESRPAVGGQSRPNNGDGGYFTTPPATSAFKNQPSGSASFGSSSSKAAATPRPGPSNKRQLHNRSMSTNTILYNPRDVRDPKRTLSNSSDDSDDETSKVKTRPPSGRNTGTKTPTSGGHKSPKRALYMASKPRPINPPRDMARTAPQRPNIPSIDTQNVRGRAPPRRLSSVDMDINSDMGLEDPHNPFGAVPSSFATQMAMATGLIKDGRTGKDSDRMSRLVLARMRTLEEGFADMVREMRVMRSTVPTAQNSGNESSGSGAGPSGGQRSSNPPSTMLEVAGGRERPKSRYTKKGKRPVIHRSQTDEKVPTNSSKISKGKGKGVISPQQIAEDDEVFNRGSSL
ncbi:hypothetical protein MKZ38_003238 [Zalerion maritima]|uniref:Ion transport domain-containing protein n=1 Tax=Zalerion maritima TaxID=339359 RepID=A0AAD5WYV9_9PEZI|nr:hypothetical protein MKZ38_003238 [Zalerion maritima]